MNIASAVIKIMGPILFNDAIIIRMMILLMNRNKCIKELKVVIPLLWRLSTFLSWLVHVTIYPLGNSIFSIIAQNYVSNL